MYGYDNKELLNYFAQELSEYSVLASDLPKFLHKAIKEIH